MTAFIQGLPLCESFFHDHAKPIIDTHFPSLRYSAGLIGYGSDVLGYDDATSTDHMWGPRFYLFLSEEDNALKDTIFAALREHLPYTYKGYSVNYTAPDPNDNGVQHPQFITEGKVNPLVFISTFDQYLAEQLGRADLKAITPYEWLAFSEHRLLSLTSGRFFIDDLHCAERLATIKYYPKDVRLYLIASNWDIIASEQAFMKRCGESGDEIGSRIICARLAERLMRLCFLYKERYAPYPKWFGRAFAELDVDAGIGQAINAALSTDRLDEREDRLVEAQALVADLHNESGLTAPVENKIESYYGRNIKVIFADKFAEATAQMLTDTPFFKTPLIGTFSQIGGLSSISDEKAHYGRIAGMYQN